jgi:hypothetical protein
VNAALNIAMQAFPSQKVTGFFANWHGLFIGWVNCRNFVDPNMPFGGYKQSGFGREHGRVAVEMYTGQKSVCIQI